MSWIQQASNKLQYLALEGPATDAHAPFARLKATEKNINEEHNCSTEGIHEKAVSFLVNVSNKKITCLSLLHPLSSAQ